MFNTKILRLGLSFTLIWDYLFGTSLCYYGLGPWRVAALIILGLSYPVIICFEKNNHICHERSCAGGAWVGLNPTMKKYITKAFTVLLATSKTLATKKANKKEYSSAGSH